MARFLHLVGRDACRLALPVIEQNRAEPGAEVTVVLLDGTAAPSLGSEVLVRRLGADDLDYAGLLDLIFESDHVVTW
jgi:hypothetical protein